MEGERQEKGGKEGETGVGKERKRAKAVKRYKEGERRPRGWRDECRVERKAQGGREVLKGRERERKAKEVEWERDRDRKGGMDAGVPLHSDAGK